MFCEPLKLQRMTIHQARFSSTSESYNVTTYYNVGPAVVSWFKISII